MKHIELKMLTVQEWLKTGRLRIHKVSTHDHRADLMTEAMVREKLIKFGRALKLRGSFFTDLGQLAQYDQLPPHDSMKEAIIMAGMDSANSASAIENDVAQIESNW